MVVHYPLFLLRLLCVWLAFAVLIFDAALWHTWPLYLLGALMLGGTLWFFDRRDAFFEPMYQNHWARPDEISDMFVRPGRLNGEEVLLAFSYGRLIALKENLAGKKELGHVLVVGPSRSGKGLHATPNLLNWRGSVVVIDIKGEFYHRTAGYRSRALGQPVYVLNPSSGAETNRFDPFAERDTDEQLLATAKAILNPDGDGSNKAFGLRAMFALFAMMKTAKLLDRPVLPFVRDCVGLGLRDAMLSLDRLTDDEGVKRNLTYFLGARPTAYEWDGLVGDKFLNNAWMNLIAKMTYLFSNGVIEMTSGSDFRATDLLREPTSVYLVFRESDLKYTVNAFSAVILSLVEAMVRHYDLHPGEKVVPVMLLFDEAGRVTVPELPELSSTVAGRGMVIIVYVQALSQLETTYGQEGAATIKSNMHTKIYFTPKDAQTAKYISDNSGKYMMEDQRHGKGDLSDSDNIGLVSRELFAVSEVMQMRTGQVLIHSNEFPYIAGYRLEPMPLPQAREAMELPPPRLARTIRMPEAGSDPAGMALPAPPQGEEAMPVTPARLVEEIPERERDRFRRVIGGKAPGERRNEEDEDDGLSAFKRRVQDLNNEE